MYIASSSTGRAPWRPLTPPPFARWPSAEAGSSVGYLQLVSGSGGYSDECLAHPPRSLSCALREVAVYCGSYPHQDKFIDAVPAGRAG